MTPTLPLILVFQSNGVTIRTGYDCVWLVERARRRALANGASFAFVEVSA